MKWCEACGSDLDAAPTVPCVACGELDISDDGYCMSCGHKQPEERDHLVVEAGTAVAVTDRGLRHRHNEDAAAVGELTGGGAVLVVCDGVSSTPGSAEVSLAAATAARDLLVTSLAPEAELDRGLSPGPVAADTSLPAEDLAFAEAVARAELGSGPEPGTDAEVGSDTEPGTDAELGTAAEVGTSDEEPDPTIAALLAATATAQANAANAPVVVSTAPHSQGGPPSSTFVAAVAWVTETGTELSVAWLGDSRAYWVGADGAVQLTGDHEEAGSLTRWLGADSFDSEPDVTRYLADGPGRLLVCSDGLWRYADQAPELAALIGRLESGHTTNKALAEALVGHAIASGGHDNITVALWSSSSDEAPTVQGEGRESS